MKRLSLMCIPVLAALAVAAHASHPNTAICRPGHRTGGTWTCATAGTPEPAPFGPSGTLQRIPRILRETDPPGGERTDFPPSVRVDDDIHPEHREPAVVWGPGDMLCASYCERATHYNPELVMFTRSSNGGLTWLDPAVLINDTEPNAVIFPAIGVLHDGTLVVVWCEMKFAPYNYEVRFSRSTDGGNTWSPSTVVHPIDPAEDYYRPSLVVAENRILVSFWQEVSYPNGRPVVVCSDDGGTTWSAPEIITNISCPYDGAAPCLAYNAVLGQVGVVMSTAGQTIIFCRSTDLGDSWSSAVQINDSAASSVDYPDLDCGQGFFHVVWYDNRHGQYDCDIFTSRSADGVSFTPNVKINDSFTGNQYEPHIRAGGDGRIHVCWIWNIPFQFNIDLYYSCSEDNGATWLEPCPRVNDIPYSVQPYVAWTSDLLADAWGNAYLFWNDGRTSAYYDNIYFTRTMDPSDVTNAESDTRPGTSRVALRLYGQPGPDPVLYLQIEGHTLGGVLELLDVSGRCLGRRHLDALPAGIHRVPLGELLGSASSTSGCHFARLHVNGRTLTRRVTWIR